MNSSKNALKHNFWTLLAVVYPFGMASKAPGTFGTLAGIPLAWLLLIACQNLSLFLGLPFWLLAISVLSLFIAASYFVIAKTEDFWKSHDNRHIVLDEVAGIAIPLVLLPWTLENVLTAFIVFRYFDIAKPGPIGWIDRQAPGAAGTLFDDVLAGIATYATINAWHNLVLPYFS